jgi:hypothetical protein
VLRRKMMLSGILLAILAVLVSFAGPASAAQGFDIATVGGAAPSDGSARASGGVTFNSRATFSISGRINDRCPGDGYGAYLYVIGAYNNGNSISATPILVATDTHNCDASADGYAFNRTFTPAAGRTVAWLRLSLYEYNANNGAYGDVTSSQYFYNPRA